MRDKMVGGAIVEPTEEQIASYTTGSVVVKILDFFGQRIEINTNLLTLHKLVPVTCTVHSK